MDGSEKEDTQPDEVLAAAARARIKDLGRLLERVATGKNNLEDILNDYDAKFPEMQITRNQVAFNPDQDPSDGNIAKAMIARLNLVRRSLRSVVEKEISLADLKNYMGVQFPEIEQALNPPSQDEIIAAIAERGRTEQNEKMHPGVDSVKSIEDVFQQEARKRAADESAAQRAAQKEAEVSSIDAAAELEKERETYKRRKDLLEGEAYESIKNIARSYQKSIYTFRNAPRWFGNTLFVRQANEQVEPVMYLRLSRTHELIIKASAGSQKLQITQNRRLESGGTGQNPGEVRWFENWPLDDFDDDRYKEGSKARTDKTTLYLNIEEFKDYTARVCAKALKEQKQKFPLRAFKMAVGASILAAMSVGWAGGYDRDETGEVRIKGAWKDFKEELKESISKISFGNIFDEHSSIIKTPDGQLYTTAPDDTSPEV